MISYFLIFVYLYHLMLYYIAHIALPICCKMCSYDVTRLFQIFTARLTQLLSTATWIGLHYCIRDDQMQNDNNDITIKILLITHVKELM